jgi:triacylglycerol lipase
VRRVAILFSQLSLAAVAPALSSPPPHIVLIHGLGLGPWSMKRIERTLLKEGYRVTNLDYDSRRVPLEELTSVWLPSQLLQHGIELTADAPPLYFVTHSMGGILLRGYLHQSGVPANMRRVVMLAPPNQGSSLVDRIGDWRAFKLSTGINGQKLSTRPDSFPRQLPPWPSGPELGILAGNRPINPLLAYWTGGPGDGKVRVSETRLEGMTDHLEVPHSHTWIQYRRSAIKQVTTFLREGRFNP